MGQLAHAVGQVPADAWGHWETLPGVIFGGRQKLGQGKRAEILVDHLPGRHFPRYRYGVGTFQGHGGVSLGPVVFARRAAGGYSAAVYSRHLAGGGFVEQHKGVSPYAAGWNDGHRLGGRYGQRGVESVAAVLEHVDSNGSGQGRIGANHAPLPVNQVSGKSSDRHIPLSYPHCTAESGRLGQFKVAH